VPSGRFSTRRFYLLKQQVKIVMINSGFSMEWFKGKSTGNHGFYHQIERGFRLKFSHHPIL
jgi:hypothetical protein